MLPFIKSLFLTWRTINSSSLVKLPALVSINKHSFQKAVLLKGLALNKKLAFHRLTFVPNQECSYLTFKSFSIHVSALHFYIKVVHFVRLPASRREQFKHLFSRCLVLPEFMLSAPSFPGLGGQRLPQLYKQPTTCRMRVLKWARKQSACKKEVDLHTSCSFILP